MNRLINRRANAGPLNWQIADLPTGATNGWQKPVIGMGLCGFRHAVFKYGKM
jgi:hypothetical protein